jgi:hypothetical protein
MLAPSLRKLLAGLRRTPLHPQWLLGDPNRAWVRGAACGLPAIFLIATPPHIAADRCSQLLQP